MKSTNRWIYAICFAVAACFSSFASASDHLLDYISAGQSLCYEASDLKFQADLAYNAEAKQALVNMVNSDLVRDSHGFRQASSIVLSSQ